MVQLVVLKNYLMASESQDPSGVTSVGGPASSEDCEDPFLSCDELEED